MALFLSTHINKIDKKGRVSVPAPFRAELSDESFKGVVLFRSNVHDCLEGFAWSYMQELGQRLDDFDLFSAEQDDLATSIFGTAVQLSMDGDGRIILPADLIEFSGLNEKVSFVGMGAKFQIWNPVNFEQRREAARKSVQSKGLTVPKNLSNLKGGKNE
jgi:MraZ protein